MEYFEMMRFYHSVLIRPIAISLLIVCSLLSKPLLVVGDDNADSGIYTDYIEGLWAIENSSPATLALNSTAQHHSYFTSIAVTSFPANSYIDIIAGWGGFPKGGFSSFDFWIHGGSQGSQQLKVSANQGTSIPLSNYGPIVSGQWKHFVIPLSDLGITSAQTQIRSFRLSGPTTASEPLFYLDDLKVGKGAASNIANVSVRMDISGPQVKKGMFGSASSVFDNYLQNSGSALRLIEGGITMMSYPGGNSSDRYRWQTNREVTTGLSGFVNTDQIAAFTQSIGADLTFTANYGSGTPQDAIDWVRYANVTHNYNVLDWAIGNEVYLPQYTYDTHTIPNDAITYGNFVADAAPAMKAIDPRIKIGISGSIGPWDWLQRGQNATCTANSTFVINPRTGQRECGWAPLLLSTLTQRGVMPDYYDFHFYPSSPGVESDAFLLQMVDRWKFLFGIMRQMLDDYLPGGAQNIPPIHLTEVNSGYDLNGLGRQGSNLINGLFAANTWAEAIWNGADRFVWWNTHESIQWTGNYHPMLYGWRAENSFAFLSSGQPTGHVPAAPPLNYRFPAFYAFKLIKQFARPGDTLIKVENDNELLRVFASVRAGSPDIRLLVINASQSMDITAPLSFVGTSGQLDQNATVYRFGTTEDASDSDLSIFTANLGATPRLTFQPYSMSTVLLHFVPSTPTPIPSRTATTTRTPSATPTRTPTSDPTTTATATKTATASAAPTYTPTASPSATATQIPTITQTRTPTSTQTFAPTLVFAWPTRTKTPTPTSTNTSSLTRTPIFSITATATPVQPLSTDTSKNKLRLQSAKIQSDGRCRVDVRLTDENGVGISNTTVRLRIASKPSVLERVTNRRGRARYVLSKNAWRKSATVISESAPRALLVTCLY